MDQRQFGIWAASLTLAATSLAQPDCGPGLTSKAGGGITTTFAANSALQIVGQGSRLALVNVSNPAAPFLVNSVELEAPVEGIASPASLLYWVVTPGRLYQINAAGIPNPIIESQTDGRFGFPGQFAYVPPLLGAKSIANNGNFQYVVGNSGTHVFLNGLPRGHRPVLGNDVTVLNGIGWGVDGLGVYRITHDTDGRTPTGFYGINLQSQGVAQRCLGVLGDGSRLLVASLNAGGTSTTCTLSVFDIDAQSELVLRAQRTFAATSRPSRIRMTRSGNTLYVLCGTAGTHWFNVTNQLAPIYGGQIASIGEDRNMSLMGTTAYIAKGAPGLRIASVAGGAAPASLGLYQPLPGNALDVDSFSNAYAVVADGDAGMSVLDIQTTPLAPVRLGTLDFGTSRRVSTGNFLAYFTTPTNITAVSYLNLSAPSVAGTWTLPGGAVPLDVLVYGQKLLVVSTDTLYVYDVSTTQTNPPLITSLALQQAFLPETQMALGNGKVFVATQGGVEAYVTNLSTGVTTFDRTIVPTTGGTTLQIAAQFFDVPPGTEYLAIVTGQLVDFGEGSQYEISAQLFTKRDFPLPRILVPFGTWLGPSVLVNDTFSLPLTVRGANWQNSLLSVVINDRVYYIDTQNLFTPAGLGSADTGFIDAGVPEVTANGVYVAGGRGGLATLKRSFNAAPVGRSANASPFNPVCGGDVTFQASFAGSPPPGTFSWYNTGVVGAPLVVDGPQADGSIVSGATTSRLTVNTLAAGFLSFVCHGSNLCGEGVSFTDFFELAPCVPACDPDVNQDGNADQSDIAYLVQIIAGGENPVGADPDFNRDGNNDEQDLILLVAVIAGVPCPF